MASIHDSGYKLLFSHPRMVEDLLRGYVDGGWLDDADFSSLSRVPGSYVAETPDARQRHEDIVWKLRLGRSWVYVYLLLEFQSVSDRWMALRLMAYAGLLYQDLVRRGELGPRRRLPPILPIVLYNGAAPWHAACELADLIAPAPTELERYRPHFRYLLLDERRLGAASDAGTRNLAATLFQLETQHTVAGLLRVIEALLDYLKGDEQASLRRAFALWICRQRHSDAAPSLDDGIDDLQEVHTMLADTMKGWFQEVEMKGRQEGLQEGREEGGRSTARAIFLRLLAQRFGVPSAGVLERVAAADIADIESWTDRLLSAASVEEVLAPPPQGSGPRSA